MNADDLGLTEGVNRAVRECRKRGVLSSTTLMANAGAFEAGAQLARQLAEEQASPRFSVGCHVVLVDGVPVLPVRDIPSLVGPGGRFRQTFSEFGQATLLGQISEDEIEHEATAQIRKLQAAGVEVTHFDTHKHVHMFPAVLRGLLRAAKSCGVPAVRNPFEISFGMMGAVLRRPALWLRYAQVQVLRRWRAGFVEAVGAAGLATCEGSLGVTCTGSMSVDLFSEMLKTMPVGTWELVCHPGYNDAELQRAGTRLLDSRVTEMELLTSPRSRELLEREQIEVISYYDIAGKPADEYVRRQD